MSEYKIRVSDMRRSSHERGCQICSLVHRGIVASEPDMVQCDSKMQWVVNRGRIRLKRRDKRMADGAWFLYFYAAPGKPGPRDSLQPGPAYELDFASDPCFASINN